MATEQVKIEKEDSAESCDFLCIMCKDKSIHRKADMFCVDCNDYYCESCVNVHKDVRFLSGHTIQNLQELPELSSTELPAVLTERCEKHPYKLVDMYCLYHDTVCCVLCQDDEHRSCKEIFSIPEYVQYESALLPEEFRANIDSAIAIMEECQSVHQHKKQYLLVKKESLLENIAQFRQEINAKLDDLQTRTVSEIVRNITALISKLEEKMFELEKDIARMKSAEKSIETSTNNKYQVFVSRKIGLKIAKKAKCLGNADVDLDQMGVPDFKGSQKILSVLDEMNVMGVVQEINTQDDEVNDKRNMADETSPNLTADAVVTAEEIKENNLKKNEPQATLAEKEKLQEKKVLQFQTKGKMIVCTKVDSDTKEIKSHGIITCCFMKNGKIILGDYDNQKLKMLHRSTYEVTNQFDLPVSPWQLCAIGDNSIAVSLGTMKEIQFFSLHYHIQKTSSFSTVHNCYGLAFTNGNFYISDSSSYIYVYSEFGIQLKQFTNNLLRSPTIINSLLEISLKSLAVNDDGSKIFVTHQTNGLIMLHNDGKDVKQYNGIQLQSGFGCHHLSGNKGLLVCGMESNNVLLFGPDGEITQQVLRWDGGHDYKLVCCNQERTKMVVCRAGTYYIEIHDLKDA